MKSTTSSSSTSSREDKSLPKLLISDSDGVNVLPKAETSKSSNQSPNSTQVISRKNSKSSLKSTSSVADVSHMTKDEIIASMVKNRMKELHDCDPDPGAPHSAHSITSDQTHAQIKEETPIKQRDGKQRKYSRSHQVSTHGMHSGL
jgi:hypothetical protein